MEPHRAINYARTHREAFLAELKAFLRFPSVSAHVRHSHDLKNCATWLATHLKRIGLLVSIVPTKGNPIVYASWQGKPGGPTILIYGHYDVLPGEPLDEWKTSPFVPTVQGSYLHGRGASDDKGQLFSHVKAIESYLKSDRTMPVNVKCVFEGEEEIGSPNLTSFITRNQRALRADAAVISDTRMISAALPAITYAERGGLRAELEVIGPRTDLHSGNFGGAIHNPLQALCQMIARLHDSDGRIAVPSFYDDVQQWPIEEREFMARSGPGDCQILDDAKVQSGWGEHGFSNYERTTIRPALTVNGITGGHQGPGAKSIIPAKASAKLSFRLVPRQNPEKIAQIFRKHIELITPPAVRSVLHLSAPVEPATIDRKHPAIRAAAAAYKQSFGASPVFLRSGGSIPVVNTIQKTLGIPAVLMGFGLPGDNIHAPNERFHLPTFYKAISASIWYFWLAASLKNAPRRNPSAGRRIG